MNDMGFLGQMWDDPQKRMLMTLGLNLLANSGQAPAGTTLGQRLGAAGMASMPMMGQLRAELKAKQDEEMQKKMTSDLSRIFAEGGDPSKVLSTISQSPEMFSKIYPHMLATQASQQKAEAKAPPGFHSQTLQDQAGNMTTVGTYWNPDTQKMETQVMPVSGAGQAPQGVEGVSQGGPKESPNVDYQNKMMKNEIRKTALAEEGKVVSEMQKNALSSIKHVKLTDAALAQLEQGIISGKGSDLLLGASKAKNMLIRALGGEPTDNSASNTEIFRALIGQGLLDYMRQMAPVSNYDVQNIKRWLGGDTSLEGPALKEILRGFRDMKIAEVKAAQERAGAYYKSVYPDDPGSVSRNLKILELPQPSSKPGKKPYQLLSID